VDNSQHIQQQVSEALQKKQPLYIKGSGSHDFMLADYNEQLSIDMTAHRGIIDYQPTELTLKARTGTPLAEIRQTLADSRQRLATDFPAYQASATLGGAVAIGHTGSGRPFQGAIRDHILGAGLVNGSANVLSCGGQVMKNVAGYDISRLLAGSRGTLGPILDITLKVMPVTEKQLTLVFEMNENQAIEAMNKMAGLSLPITAASYFDGKVFIRLEGTESGLNQAKQGLGGEQLASSETFWDSIQQQSHEFFNGEHPVWRIVVPASTPELELEHQQRSLIDWCGGLRWVHAEKITQSDFIHISNMGGYIENHRGSQATHPADLMTALQKQMHGKIKNAFDPENLFNPRLSNFE